MAASWAWGIPSCGVPFLETELGGWWGGLSCPGLYSMAMAVGAHGGTQEVTHAAPAAPLTHQSQGASPSRRFLVLGPCFPRCGVN